MQALNVFFLLLWIIGTPISLILIAFPIQKWPIVANRRRAFMLSLSIFIISPVLACAYHMGDPVAVEEDKKTEQAKAKQADEKEKADEAKRDTSKNMMDLPASQTLAKQNLLGILKDPDSAKFQDVLAYKLIQGDKTLFVFCGQVNSKNSFGGYDGYGRFVATPVLSTIESEQADFETTWEQFCTGEPHSVWF